MNKSVCFVVLIAALMASATAAARMYQWMDPNSGNVQLSGSPPAWYRGVHGGPRVLVFEGGELIDDTANAVDEGERLSLRDAAFGGLGAELGVIAQQEKQRDELKDALAKARESGIDIDAVAAEVEEEQAQLETVVDGAEDLNSKVATLKSLIDAWDQRQLDDARSILGLFPEQTPAPE